MKLKLDHKEEGRCVELSLAMALDKDVRIGVCHDVRDRAFRRRFTKVMKRAGIKGSTSAKFLTVNEPRNSMEYSWEGRGICRVGFRREDGTACNSSHMVAYENGMIYNPTPDESSSMMHTDYFGDITDRGMRFVMYKKRLRR